MKWTVKIGERVEEISSDLLLALGFEDAEFNGERAYYSAGGARYSVPPELLEALALDLHGDNAAIFAAAQQSLRQADLSLEGIRAETARLQKETAVLDLEAQRVALQRSREENPKKGGVPECGRE
jgi:hypothetical protein